MVHVSGRYSATVTIPDLEVTDMAAVPVHDGIVEVGMVVPVPQMLQAAEPLGVASNDTPVQVEVVEADVTDRKVHR